MRTLKTSLIQFLMFACYSVALADNGFVAVGASPFYAKIDGVDCEGRSLRWETVYICSRDRKEEDLEIGGRVYGTDDAVRKDEPRTIISRILFSPRPSVGPIKAAWYELPNKLIRDLTEPNLAPKALSPGYFSIVGQGQKVIIYLHAGDAGGGYEVNWIIDEDKLRVRRMVISHGGPDDTLKDKWFQLQRISQPEIKEIRK